MKMQPDDQAPTRNTLASTKADLRELKDNSQATVQELQSFLRELKGKNPQEMLGIVAASHLIRSLILSSILILSAVVILTALPYFFGKENSAETTSTSSTSPPNPTAPTADVPTPTPLPPDPTTPSPEPDPLAPLGVGDQLPAPPNENPLESNPDDFLKDLK